MLAHTQDTFEVARWVVEGGVKNDASDDHCLVGRLTRLALNKWLRIPFGGERLQREVLGPGRTSWQAGQAGSEIVLHFLRMDRLYARG
jgi:hypothetical protein